MATGMTAPGAERYSVVEYMKDTNAILAKMEKGPAQIVATSIRDYIATQWDELCIEGSELVEDLKRFGSALKDQHALMTADALCNMFDRAINDMIIIANPLDEWKEGLADIAWRIQKAGELTEGIARSFVKLQDGIFTPMDTEKFITLVRNGNTQEAARMMVDANPMFGAIQERVVHNLQHPVSFLGRTSRGLLDVGMTGEQVFADALLHPLRTEAEQAMLSAQYTETFENFVKTLNTATPEQINDVVASAIADGLTFKVWHSAHSAIRASETAAGGGASSSSSGTGIVPQQQPTAVPSVPGSFAESEPPAIRVTPRLIAAQQARQQSGASFHPELVEGSSSSSKTVVVDDKGKGRAPQLTKEQKAQQKALRAKERYYLKQHQEEQKRLCPEHGVKTAKGRHELTIDQKPDGWHDVVPGDLEHEILAKPFDYTRHTHVHPDLPTWMNENPRPIKINYEHITSPDLKTACKKGQISRSGFHHDPGRAIEKSGMIEVKDIKALPHGCYQFEWRSCGSTFKPSTMFPENWTRAQTIEKIYESMENTSKIEWIEARKPSQNHRYRHFGFTSEGIEILSIVEVSQDAAKVVSAYPWFTKK